MTRLVALCSLGVGVAFASCAGNSRSSHQGGSGSGASAGEAGEASGGEGFGGSVATGGAGGGIGGTGGVSGIGGVGPPSDAGGSDPGGSGSGGGGSGSVPCGSFDCTRLPNVRSGAAVSCIDGVCVVTPDACEEGFAHCSTNVNVGCEANLHSSEHCGSCETRCTGTTPACTLGPNGWRCSEGCEEPTPDRCQDSCTDFDTDGANCGDCRVDCQSGHAPGVCRNGGCERTGPCAPRWGDCNDGIGCESNLTVPADCGACGRGDCGAFNAAPECSSPDGCVPPVCGSGFGNCDRTSFDCRASYGAPCFPTYAGTTIVADASWQQVALAADGSFALVSGFGGELDFDPTSGVDQKTSAGQTDACVSRYSASGAYLGTQLIGGTGGEYGYAVALAGDGSLVVAGGFSGDTDLDPGPGVDPHTAGVSGAGFIVKLTAAGSFAWGRVFHGEVSFTRLAVDAAGAVHALAHFIRAVDVDPGPGVSRRDSGDDGSSFVVKLDSNGNFVWDATLEGTGSRAFTGLALGPDGTVWTAGRHGAGNTLLGRALGADGGVLLASFTPGGTLATLWTPGVATNFSNQPALGASSNVFVGGLFDPILDVDPGPVTVTRVSISAYGASGFVTGLAPGGGHLMARVFEAEPVALLATPAGAVIAVIPRDPHTSINHLDLRAFDADGTSLWTLSLNDNLFARSYAVNTTSFVILGDNGASSDYDPGPDTDTVPGPATVVTRFGF